MHRPPTVARWVLGRLVAPDDRTYFLGDLDEAFADRHETLGSAAARWWYWRQTLASLGPLVRHRLTSPPRRPTSPTGDPMWREFLDDLRFVARISARNRIASFAVVATLILGIGATTAVFSVVNAILIRPLPFNDSG